MTKLVLFIMSVIGSVHICLKDFNQYNSGAAYLILPVMLSNIQGNLISPLLFIVYRNDSLNEIPLSNLLTYADDVMIMAFVLTEFTVVNDS